VEFAGDLLKMVVCIMAVENFLADPFAPRLHTYGHAATMVTGQDLDAPIGDEIGV
jgi:hypothetical protein